MTPPQSELLTLKCLGLKLGRLGGEGECRVADPLGIWQPPVLEPHPRQAGRLTNYPQDIFYFQGRVITSYVPVNTGSECTWAP